VSPGEVQESVLAFLDQFIARGAADDLRNLRERLATQPEVQRRLSRQVTGDRVSEREAFDAMRRFLQDMAGEASPGKGGADLIDLLSWTEWESDDGTRDPARWDDWQSAVSSVTRA
jgi:hypothetical protein